MSLSQSHHSGGLLHLTQQDQSDDDNVIVRHYEFLVDQMSPEFGLVDKLYSKRILSELQKDEIEDRSLIQNRNKILLKHIVQEKAFEKLFEALKECGQSHLVQYLEADGVYRQEFGGNWPLMEKERTILLENYETLIDLLDCSHSGLVELLYQTGVLNRRQMDLVSLKVTRAEQNKVLLKILRKGSLYNFWQMIRCLHLSNQSHVANIFESGGVVVRIDANLQTESSNLTEIENSIVAEFTNILRQPYVSDANRILDEVKLNLVGATAKHSVSLYFLCSDLSDIDRLEQMASNGQLKKIVQDLFNRLIEFPVNIGVTLKWSRYLLSKSRKHIKAIQVKNFIAKPIQTTIEDLPLELLDTILQRAYLWSSLQSDGSDDDKNSGILFLGSVNVLWFQRIQGKRFKKPILPHLPRIYRRKFEMYLSIRGCLRYLEEAIQVKDVRLTRRDLLAADFYTDLQIARHVRRRIRMNKCRKRSEMLATLAEAIQAIQVEDVSLTRRDLLAADLDTDFQIGRHVRRRIRKDNYRKRSGMLSTLAEDILPVKRGYANENIKNNFIRFLRQITLMIEARVLEDGGATAKVEIRQPKTSKTVDKTNNWSRIFSSRLNNLKDKHMLRADDLIMLIQQLEDSGLEIIDSFVDRGVIVWIWCKSQNAIETLKALYESQDLINPLYRLAKANDLDRSTKDIHLEEYNHLKIDTVSLPNLVINVEGKLESEDGYKKAIGVTKLRNTIFVLDQFWSSSFLLNTSCILYVFDDQHPFRLRRKLPFEEIKRAICISCFEKNLCLYIADIGTYCIWKIRLPEEDKIEDGEFTCTALGRYRLPLYYDKRFGFKMTITDGGQILIIDSMDPILRIFDLESDFNSPIQINLPDAIKQPIKVAENSFGNFIFLHRTLEKYSHSDEDRWIVSEVDRKGRTIIRQNLGIGSQWLQHHGVAFITVDRSDRILLADTRAPRVILLDSSLRYVQSFIMNEHICGKYERNRLLYPWNIFYDDDKNQIIVCGEEMTVFYRDDEDHRLYSQKKFFNIRLETIHSTRYKGVHVYRLSLSVDSKF